MSNFLDDKLYEHLNNRKFNDVNEFIIVLNELYKICEDHWKPTMKNIYENKSMPVNDAKIELKGFLNKCFNAWNIFVNRLQKENYYMAKYLGQYSYKNQFMDDPKLKELYNKL